MTTTPLGGEVVINLRRMNRIRAIDADNNESSPVAITGVTALDNPSGLTITPNSGYVAITWTPILPAEYVKQYAIYVSETPITSIVGRTPRLHSREPSARIARLWAIPAETFAQAVASPRVVLVRKAAAIIIPSMRLCKPSLMRLR